MCLHVCELGRHSSARARVCTHARGALVLPLLLLLGFMLRALRTGVSKKKFVIFCAKTLPALAPSASASSLPLDRPCSRLEARDVKS